MCTLDHPGGFTALIAFGWSNNMPGLNVVAKDATRGACFGGGTMNCFSSRGLGDIFASNGTVLSRKPI